MQRTTCSHRLLLLALVLVAAAGAIGGAHAYKHTVISVAQYPAANKWNFTMEGEETDHHRVLRMISTDDGYAGVTADSAEIWGTQSENYTKLTSTTFKSPPFIYNDYIGSHFCAVDRLEVKCVDTLKPPYVWKSWSTPPGEPVNFVTVVAELEWIVLFSNSLNPVFFNITTGAVKSLADSLPKAAALDGCALHDPDFGPAIAIPAEDEVFIYSLPDMVLRSNPPRSGPKATQLYCPGNSTYYYGDTKGNVFMHDSKGTLLHTFASGVVKRVDTLQFFDDLKRLVFTIGFSHVSSFDTETGANMYTNTILPTGGVTSVIGNGTKYNSLWSVDFAHGCLVETDVNTGALRQTVTIYPQVPQKLGADLFAHITRDEKFVVFQLSGSSDVCVVESATGAPQYCAHTPSRVTAASAPSKHNTLPYIGLDDGMVLMNGIAPAKFPVIPISTLAPSTYHLIHQWNVSSSPEFEIGAIEKILSVPEHKTIVVKGEKLLVFIKPDTGRVFHHFAAEHKLVHLEYDKHTGLVVFASTSAMMLIVPATAVILASNYVKPTENIDYVQRVPMEKCPPCSLYVMYFSGNIATMDHVGKVTPLFQNKQLVDAPCVMYVPNEQTGEHEPIIVFKTPTEITGVILPAATIAFNNPHRMGRRVTTDLIATPDRSLFLFGTSKGYVEVYNGTTGKIFTSLDADVQETVTQITFFNATDGCLMAVFCVGQNTVAGFDVDSGYKFFETTLPMTDLTFAGNSSRGLWFMHMTHFVHFDVYTGATSFAVHSTVPANFKIEYASVADDSNGDSPYFIFEPVDALSGVAYVISSQTGKGLYHFAADKYDTGLSQSYSFVSVWSGSEEYGPEFPPMIFGSKQGNIYWVYDVPYRIWTGAPAPPKNEAPGTGTIVAITLTVVALVSCAFGAVYLRKRFFSQGVGIRGATGTYSTINDDGGYFTTEGTEMGGKL